MSETTKDKALELIRRLPEDVTLDDIIYELDLSARIERGFKEDADGMLIPHDQVVQKISRWLKSAGR